MKMSTKIIRIGKAEVPNPVHGDVKLSVFPFENTGKRLKLPDGFKIWEPLFNRIMSQVPLSEGNNQHFVTIDSKFFTQTDYLRREGIHADGNFCVDPEFRGVSSWGNIQPTWGNIQPARETWGGISPTWGGLTPEPKETWGGILPGETWGRMALRACYTDEERRQNKHVKMDWVLPYDIEIPIGEYISGEKGGILTIASETGCQGWDGEFYGEIGSGGDCSHLVDQCTDDKKKIFEKDTLYFMTSNTPHETMLIEKGTRRTLIRITLNHNYPNELLPCVQKELQYA